MAGMSTTRRPRLGPSTLWRIPTAGGDPETVLDGVSERAFVVLEKGIYYVERQGAGAKIGVSSPVALLLWGRMTARGFDSSILRPPKSRVLADLGERVRLRPRSFSRRTNDSSLPEWTIRPATS